MHSYGTLVEDAWLLNALSIYSVPIDLTYRTLEMSAQAFHGPGTGQPQVLA